MLCTNIIRYYIKICVTGPFRVKHVILMYSPLSMFPHLHYIVSIYFVFFYGITALRYTVTYFSTTMADCYDVPFLSRWEKHEPLLSLLGSQ